MQPWSPLPRLLRNYPCKNFQEKSLFQPVYVRKEAKSQHQLIQKSVILQTLQSGFWGKMNLKGAYKNPSLFIGNPFASQHSKRTLDKSISEFIGRTGQLHQRAMHQSVRTTRWVRATHQRPFCSLKLLRRYA